MFEKMQCEKLYKRDNFTMKEKLFDTYISMRNILKEIENYKYGVVDTFENSEEFKQGFLAGVKIMSSMLLDL